MLRKAKKLALTLTVLAGVFLTHATAWAQQQQPVERAEKSWPLSYFLVGFVVALALVIVMRGTSRRDKPKMVESELKHKLEQLQSKN